MRLCANFEVCVGGWVAASRLHNEPPADTYLYRCGSARHAMPTLPSLMQSPLRPAAAVGTETISQTGFSWLYSICSYIAETLDILRDNADAAIATVAATCDVHRFLHVTCWLARSRSRRQRSGRAYCGASHHGLSRG